jgi:hypothetical protein
VSVPRPRPLDLWPFACCATALLVAACSPKPAAPPAPVATAPAAPAPITPQAPTGPSAASAAGAGEAAPTPVAAAGAATVADDSVAAAAKEAAAYSQRRLRQPPVIGGCDERCETPEQMMGTLFEALGRPAGVARREALSVLFDFSQLREDGDEHGMRWAEMWAKPPQHATRRAEIDAWLDRFGAVVERLEGDNALMKWRARGARFVKIPGRTDLIEISLDAPPTAADRARGRWRLIAVLRGWEWLITSIERAPADGPPVTRGLAGSAQRGRL